MEHGRRPPAERPESTSSDDEPAPNLPRRSAFEYLRELLQRSQEKHAEQDDDDDESLDETGKKKRRVRHFLGNMLALKEVKKTTINSDESENVSPPSTEKLTLSGVVDVEPPASILTPDLAQESAVTRDINALSNEGGAEVSPIINESVYANSARRTTGLENAILPTAETAEPNSGVDDTTEVTPTFPVTPQELPLGEHAHAPEVTIPLHDRAEAAGDRPAFDRTERVTQRVVERGSDAPIVTLMAAEVLSRHRDKKLRRTDETQAKQIAELADTQRKLVEAQTRAVPKQPEMPTVTPAQEHIVLPPNPAPETISPKKVEKSPQNKRITPVTPEAKPTKLSAEQAKPLTEASKPESLAEILKTPHFEKTNATKEAVKPLEVSPNKVLEKVKQAAEEDLPIEALFEHRHEALDEAKQQADSNSSVASVSHPGDSGVDSVVPSQSALANASTDDDRALSKLDPRFKKAAISGFWTALVIIAALIVITILST